MFLTKRSTVGVATLAGALVLLVFGCDNPAAMNRSTVNVTHVTQADFTNEVLRRSQPVVVDFYATWCAPCREEGLLLDRIADGYAGRIKFIKVNVDESPDLARVYQVEVMPLLVMLTNGVVVGRLTGLPGETELKGRLDALAARKP